MHSSSPETFLSSWFFSEVNRLGHSGAESVTSCSNPGVVDLEDLGDAGGDGEAGDVILASLSILALPLSVSTRGELLRGNRGRSTTGGGQLWGLPLARPCARPCPAVGLSTGSSSGLATGTGTTVGPAGHASAADIGPVCLWQVPVLGHLGLPKVVEGGPVGLLALEVQ